MSEQLDFMKSPGTGRSLFVHTHIPKQGNGCGYLMLNPAFDEKKRSQKFQAETGRMLAERGFTVLRFDYQGSGDSDGATHTMDWDQNVADAQYLSRMLKERFQLSKIGLIGIRIGADLAIQVAESDAIGKHIIMVQPVISGKRYLTEQRLRRKTFQVLHKMEVETDLVDIDGHQYEDFQGYPLSNKSLTFLVQLDTGKTTVRGKKLDVIRVNEFTSKKLYQKLKEGLSEANQFKEIKISGPEFWASMDSVDTAAISTGILEIATTSN